MEDNEQVKERIFTIIGIKMEPKHPKRLEKVIDFFFKHPTGEYSSAQISDEISDLTNSEIGSYCRVLRSVGFIAGRVKKDRQDRRLWSKKREGIT